MALLKFGSLVTAGTGSLGGHTIQHSKGGMQLRNKPISRNQPSESQRLIRSINPLLQKGWRDLSDTQRKVWNDYAPAPLSGHAFWMKCMYYYYYSGKELIWLNNHPILKSFTWPAAFINVQLSTECTLYWVAFPYETAPVAPLNIKAWHNLPPDISFCGGGSLHYPLYSFIPVLQVIQRNLFHNKFHSFHVFAEYMNGISTPTKKITFTTIT